MTGGLECNGGTANRNSIFNFLKSTSAVGADVALHSRAVKTAGANSTIPIGILGTTDATGGGFDHGVGVLGLAEPNASSLIGNGYYGVEGRVDNAKDSLTVASGVLGLGILAIDAPGGFTGSAGVEGKVELASGITGDATHVGIAGRFRVMLGAGTALGAGNYWNALLGDSTTNIRTTFRGGVNGGDGDADFTILDTIDKLHIDLKSPLTGVAFDLADAAGANTFIIRDSGDATVLSINSDGNVDAEGTLTAGISNAFSVNSSGEITAATSTNTINSLIINAGALSGITGYTQTSGTVSITSNSTSGNSLSLTNTTLNSNGSTLAGLSFTENLSATGTVNGLTLTPTLSGTAVANTYTTNVVNVANVAGTCPATATCVNNGLNLGTGLTNYIKAANFTVDAVAGNITAGTYNGVTLSTTSLNFGSAAPVIANSGANPIAIKSGNGLLTLNTASQA
ncbi:MAG TPA: hypothetical protein VFK94_02660, partial [Patescibacteria group bacterium]|nr:hypothetical protein [Patescibacteria group bacterium]